MLVSFSIVCANNMSLSTQVFLLVTTPLWRCTRRARPATGAVGQW